MFYVPSSKIKAIWSTLGSKYKTGNLIVLPWSNIEGWYNYSASCKHNSYYCFSGKPASI